MSDLDLADRIERRWALLSRRVPYVLLAVSFVLAVPLAGELGTSDRLPLLVVLAGGAAAAHWWCVDRRWGRSLDDTLGKSYAVVRTAYAFVLTWLNPFFCVYAFIGYIDTPLYLRLRGQQAVLVATAATMAGAQSGGFPPSTPWQGVAFAGLFGLNAVLAGVFAAMASQETELAEERTSTIAELEVTNHRLEEALAENAALQDALVQRAREAGVHDERERLAAEIHDTIAQGLAGIVTQLQAADEAVEPEAAHAHRKRAAELARTALDEARRSVQALNPTALDRLGLVETLRERVREWGEDSGVAATFVVTGDPEPVAPAPELVVLRVVQESLTNVVRHAGASRVAATLSYTGDELVLDVVDDGSGFAPDAQASTGGGFGLVGMRRRAERAGGELVVESEPGQGTAVSLRIPTENHA